MTFELTRRQFLSLTAAAGSAALLAPFTWHVLAAPQRRTLLGVARTLFPHEGASNAAYVQAVAAIDWRCREDRETRLAILHGIAGLERDCGEPFAESPEPKRVALLKTRERERFFRIVYTEMLDALYGSTESWKLFAVA